jgi:hypothetical protein
VDVHLARDSMPQFADLLIPMTVGSTVLKWNNVTRVFDEVVVESLDIQDYPTDTLIYTFATISPSGVETYTGKMNES